MLDDDPFAPPVKKPMSLEAQLENASIGDLEARIERLKTEIQMCEKAIEAKRAQREAAEALDLVERQYASGVATIFELIDAQSRLITAESQLIRARLERATNRVDLHLAIAGDFAAGGDAEHAYAVSA